MAPIIGVPNPLSIGDAILNELMLSGMKTLRDRLATAMRGPPQISQVDLAKSVGVSQPSVNDWLSGKTKSIRGPALLAVARRLGVQPDWLATGKGPMRDSAPTSPAASQSVRLNPATMAEAYRLLRNSLAMQGIVFDVAENPELLCMTYEYLSEAEVVTPSNLVDFGKRLAEARTKGAKHGQGGTAGKVDSGGI